MRNFAFENIKIADFYARDKHKGNCRKQRFHLYIVINIFTNNFLKFFTKDFKSA